jgi:hypothetical protein
MLFGIASLTSRRASAAPTRLTVAPSALSMFPRSLVDRCKRTGWGGKGDWEADMQEQMRLEVHKGSNACLRAARRPIEDCTGKEEELRRAGFARFILNDVCRLTPLRYTTQPHFHGITARTLMKAYVPLRSALRLCPNTALESGADMI